MGHLWGDSCLDLKQAKNYSLKLYRRSVNCIVKSSKVCDSVSCKSKFNNVSCILRVILLFYFDSIWPAGFLRLRVSPCIQQTVSNKSVVIITCILCGVTIKYWCLLIFNVCLPACVRFYGQLEFGTDRIPSHILDI